MKTHTHLLQYVSLLALLCLLASPLHGQQHTPSLDKFDWLVGTWVRETEKSLTYESWQRLSDRTFEGVSVRIAKATQDTVFTEALLLAEMGGEIFYIPKVAENVYPVPFKLTIFEPDCAVFENPGHDFPQKISYERQSPLEMTAIASGTIDGQARQIPFRFRKKQEDEQ